MRPSRSAAWSPPATWVVGRGDWGNLLRTVGDALAIFPPLYCRSVLGSPWSWRPPLHRYSELRIIDVWQPRRTLTFLANVTWPSIPASPPPCGPSFVTSLFWQPSEVLQRPDHRGSYTSYPREAWFFINGILTNDDLAHVNAAYLADLFHRPIAIIQNSTSSLPLDLLECAAGKQWYRTTESVRKAFPAIYDALTSEKEKVVVVAHSQGTIIMSVVLRLLKDSVHLGMRRAWRGAAGAVAPVFPVDYPLRLEEFEPLTAQELAKLEIYCFANCANTMTYFAPGDDDTPPVPWIENFGNEYDIVARLGMQAPEAGPRGVHISGPKYVRPCAWGHLLNAHYLAPIDEDQRAGYARGGRGGCVPFELATPDEPHDEAGPRLFAYINGGEPTRRAQGSRPRAQAKAQGARLRAQGLHN